MDATKEVAPVLSPELGIYLTPQAVVGIVSDGAFPTQKEAEKALKEQAEAAAKEKDKKPKK